MMYYLVDEKNESGTYEVWSPRHVKDGQCSILYTFNDWDDVMSYMTNPVKWISQNLEKEHHHEEIT